MVDKQDKNQGVLISTEGSDFPQCAQAGSTLINQTIMQILVQKETPEEIKDLMGADLDYNRKRLEILREHMKLHPDSIEERKNKRFRRYQYVFLMAAVCGLFVACPFLPTAIAVAFSAAAMMILAGIILNGRDRDADSEVIAKIVAKMGDKS